PQVTRRHCLDRIRRAPRDQPADEPDVEALDPDDAITRLDEAMWVHAGMADLPENCREILDRFFARDESYRQIGDALALPAGTIASRISRCLAKLREQFEGRNPVAAASSDQVT